MEVAHEEAKLLHNVDEIGTVESKTLQHASNLSYVDGSATGAPSKAESFSSVDMGLDGLAIQDVSASQESQVHTDKWRLHAV